MHIDCSKLFLISNQIFKILFQAVLQCSILFLLATSCSFGESGVLCTVGSTVVLQNLLGAFRRV